jgi:hypothetical protein
MGFGIERTFAHSLNIRECGTTGKRFEESQFEASSLLLIVKNEPALLHAWLVYFWKAVE